MGEIKKYSIILPVKNGGEYLKVCVNSILSQQLNNFNLIILDNCSTDGTSEWLNSVKDSRIIIHKAEKSLTIEENWKRVLYLPKNEFMTLIGHDDILHENYLTEMDTLISKHPKASLYQSHFFYIDSRGKKIRDCKRMNEVETGADFLKTFLTNQVDIMGTGFMMRSSDYDRIGGIPDYPNLLFADFELWLNLTKLSFKATSPHTCFSFRVHQSTTSTSPDAKMQKAFERFIYFLISVKKESGELSKTISQNAIPFISFYCKGLSHRLLRTPIHKRGDLTVDIFIQKCKDYADLLVPGNTYNPASVFTVRLAKILDSNSVSRYLFLLFKKIYSKPVLK